MRIATAALAMTVLAGALAGCVPLVVGGAAAGVAVAHDRRTASAVLQDQLIEATLYDRLARDKDFGDDTHISVTSYNQIVLLTGEVPTRELGLRAAQYAREHEKVRQVHNELVISAPSSLASRSNDALITTAAKSSLLGVDIEGFDPTRVKIVTEAGTVYLMGLVTREEAEKVSDQVRRTQGVRKVVRLFELID